MMKSQGWVEFFDVTRWSRPDEFADVLQTA